jgi:hypothetical protein
MLLTVKQAHALLNKAVGINKLREMMRDGIIQSQWLGNKLVTTQEDVQRWITRRQKEQNRMLSIS